MKKWIAILLGAVCGFIMGAGSIAINISFFKVIPILLVQLIIFVTCHELSHGFIAQKNGLSFSVLYLGPFTFKRKNNKFEKEKGMSFQGTYLGRAQIDNNEILNEDDFKKHTDAWIKAILAGPISDVILVIISLVLALTFKSLEILISTVIICATMCIPSYIMGDGNHRKKLKNDKVFTDSIMYTYSIIGNKIISKESKDYLRNKLIKDIEREEVNKDTLIGLACAIQMLYQDYFNEDINKMPNNLEQIIDECIKNNKVFLSKSLEQSYYKGLIVASIIYNVVYKEDKNKAIYFFNEIKELSFNMPGELLEFYRAEHILGIDNREKELSSDKYINPMVKGCSGIYEIERKINKMIIEEAKKRYSIEEV